jgi:hypothetical protein
VSAKRSAHSGAAALTFTLVDSLLFLHKAALRLTQRKKKEGIGQHYIAILQ